MNAVQRRQDGNKIHSFFFTSHQYIFCAILLKADKRLSASRSTKFVMNALLLIKGVKALVLVLSVLLLLSIIVSIIHSLIAFFFIGRKRKIFCLWNRLSRSWWSCWEGRICKGLIRYLQHIRSLKLNIWKLLRMRSWRYRCKNIVKFLNFQNF